MIALRKLHEPDYCSKTLGAKIRAYGREVDALAAREQAVPENQRQLGERIIAGEITGNEAVAERWRIEKEAQAIQIDTSVLYHKKGELQADLQKAHRQEAQKHKAIAEARRAEMEKQLDGIGRPVDRETLIRADEVYRKAMNKYRGLMNASNASVYTDEEREWFFAFTLTTKRMHGIPVEDLTME